MRVFNFICILVIISAFSSIIYAQQPQLVTVAGNKLIYEGREYFIKGANVGFGRFYHTGNRKQMWWDFHPDLLEQEIFYLKRTLGINTIRIFLPEPRGFDEQMAGFHFNEDWFANDGKINPLYLDHLKLFLNLCQKYDLKVQLSLYGPPLDLFINATAYNYAPVGGQVERFWYTYIESLIPEVKTHPAIMSYEMLNESLVNAAINYEAPSPLYEQRIMSFTYRMIKKIRSMDPNHLITSAEGIFPPDDRYRNRWWYPDPEFALISDVDNLNNGQPFSLYSLVDYISPHFYNHNIGSVDNVSQAINVIKNHSLKPIIFGEMGYFQNAVIDTQTGSAYRADQELFIRNTLNEIKSQGLSGFMVFDPWPLLILEPGNYTKTLVLINNKWPEMRYDFIKGRLNGQWTRLSTNDDDQFYLYDYKLAFFPAGNTVANSFLDKVPNNTIVGDVNGNNQINISDYLTLTDNFNQDYMTTGNINSDLNRDGKVDLSDITILIKNFGQTD